MTTVDQWTGQHTAVLRRALRMSIQDFAARLGIHERTVSKWEARAETITLRPINQASLDEVLRRADSDVHARMEAAFGTGKRSMGNIKAPSGKSPGSSLRHPLDRKTMLLVPAGRLTSRIENTNLWLGDFYVDSYPVTNGDYLRFVRATDRRPLPHWECGTPSVEDLELPAVRTTQADARAYARWAGKELPTVAHLEKAVDVVGGHREELGYEEGLFEWCRDVVPATERRPRPPAATAGPRDWVSTFSLAELAIRLDEGSNCRDDVGLRCVASVVRFPS